MVELYVDDELVINCFTGSFMKQGVGLFASGGIAQFSELRYYCGVRPQANEEDKSPATN